MIEQSWIPTTGQNKEKHIHYNKQVITKVPFRILKI